MGLRWLWRALAAGDVAGCHVSLSVTLLQVSPFRQPQKAASIQSLHSLLGRAPRASAYLLPQPGDGDRWDGDTATLSPGLAVPCWAHSISLQEGGLGAAALAERGGHRCTRPAAHGGPRGGGVPRWHQPAGDTTAATRLLRLPGHLRPWPA